MDNVYPAPGGSALKAIRTRINSPSEPLTNKLHASDNDTDNDSIGADLGLDGNDENDDQSQSEDSSDCSLDNAVDPLEPVRGEVLLVPSLFPHRPPAIYFDYPKAMRELSIVRGGQGPGADYYVEELNGRKIFYKSQWERNCIKASERSERALRKTRIRAIY